MPSHLEEEKREVIQLREEGLTLQESAGVMRCQWGGRGARQIQRYVMQPGATRCMPADSVMTALSLRGSPCLTPARVRCSLSAVESAYAIVHPR